MPNTQQRQKMWVWWTQIRDVAASAVGLAIFAASIIRNEYNITAMVVALACLGIVSTSVLTKWLIGRWDTDTPPLQTPSAPSETPPQEYSPPPLLPPREP